MVGIVIVSHSAALAEGVAELAGQMGGPEVAIEPAGGVDAPDNPLGTDAVRVSEAIARADSGDGALVLMDLGSAVLSAELALDFLPEEVRERVRLSAAPLVEGAVAAAVAARLGASLDEVATEARGAVAPKAAQLGEADAQQPAAAGAAPAEGEHTVRLVVANRLGLHARPAANVVKTAGRFDAEIAVTNLATGHGPASARSLNALATLGAREGHELLVSARGPEAAAALAAIGELASHGFGEDVDVAPPSAPAAVPAPASAPEGMLPGLAAAPGIVAGPARRLRVPEIDVPASPAQDPAAEWAALERALARVGEGLRATRASVAARAGEESATIFDAHLLFLEDEALLDPTRRAIFDEGRNASQAWADASSRVAGAYDELEDEYLRVRAADVRAVARDVVAALAGADASPRLDEPGIVLAPDLTPRETAGLDRTLVLGVATAYGAPTSHAAILARSLGIPAAVALGDGLLSLDEGTEVLLDGDAGVLHVRPSAEVLAEVEARGEEREEAAQRARAGAHEPARTLDGRRIEVFANLGSTAQVAEAVAAGAEGVGLLRTEFLFLARTSAPSEEEQVAAYRAIAEGLRGRPLVVRTLDVGGDKPLPFLAGRAEANPFLGLRGIRLALAERELLETQLRAVLRVAADHPVRVMFPMVATAEELRAAKAVLHDARSRVAVRGAGAAELPVGVMIEVPAAALSAATLAAEAEFFSIGTNDLAQYTMAAERGNDRVAALTDALHPPVLRLIATVTAAAAERGLPVAVCGELASDSLAVAVLVGLRVDELSVSPPLVPAIKEAVRELDSAAAAALADRALALDSAAGVRALLADEAAQRVPTSPGTLPL